MSDDFSVRFTLLDNQVVDADRLPVGRVDDLELDVDSGAPRINGILIGMEPLGERMGGWLGRLLAATSSRAREAGSGPATVDPALVDQFSPMIRLRAPLAQLEQVASLERWLSRHIISKVPGGGDALE